MNIKTHSQRHAGGTYAPTTWERGCPPQEIWGGHAAEVVPQRATRHRRLWAKSLFRREFFEFGEDSGTSSL